MRILKVRFKNLNSLVGEWEIDLAHPAFVSDGIFAITGPTGAGKTTILDAVCLALYGRTPRLSRVTKSGNEIMSRQTGECFAEVTFETQAGRFRCHWSQRRARKKPDGELQNPKHEISDADSGRIFETKIRGVADQIEAATGMDFDRFTRSMLLAQGGFAAFLQEAPDERAPILEQITGTEIYSRISIRVHERRSEERKRLDGLQAELAGMQLLGPEDEQLLAAGLEQKLRQDSELARELARTNQAITWIEGIARLQEELRLLGQARGALQARIETFVPEQERLDAANRALELSADHAALTAMRKEQESDSRTLRECRETLPVRTEAAGQADKAMKEAAGRLEARKTELLKAQPVIRKVRELDLKRAGKDAPIREANDSIARLAASLEALRSRQANDVAELDGTRSALSEVRQLLEATRTDESLVGQLSGIRNRFDSLKFVTSQLAGKLEEAEHAECRLQEATKAWQQQTVKLEGEKQNLAGIQGAYAEAQAGLLKILEGREPGEWRQTHALLTARKELVARVLAAVLSMSQAKQATVDLESRRTELGQEESSLTDMLAARSEKESALEKEMGLLETQLTLLKRIEAFEEARGRLRDGEPCPLCGATEHPFAEGNVPVPGETQLRLAAVRAELKAVSGDVSDLKVKLAKVSKDLEQVSSFLKENADRVGEAGRLIEEICSQLPQEPKLTASDPAIEQRLEELQEETACRLEYTAGIVEAAEAAERKQALQRAALEKARESVAGIEREVLTAAHGKESAGQLLERLTQETGEFRDQQERSLAQLRSEVKSFGIELSSVAELGASLEQLTARRDQWLSRNEKKTELEKRAAALELQTRHQAEQLLAAEQDLRQRQEQLAVLLRERDGLSSERQELFGDRDADAEEARLSAAIEAAEKELDADRRKSEAVHRELLQLKAEIGKLEQAVLGRDLQLNASDQAFLARLKQSGFSDEANFLSCCLPESDRKLLTQQSLKLAEENTELVSREREKAALLESECRKQVTEQSLDDLKNESAVLGESQKGLQQEIGAIRQKLTDNENLKQQHRERVTAIEARKRECLRWDQLHELIGSADGKKYRNFAQGLTFEMMVGHANRQLQKMSDRYLLVRDEDQPLELNVLDNYQAGEVRSTKNLSGGECFIVSLSLALGLSHMASRNVRVDSLFLDEGFGTLDEEALDTALETLAGLQQDSKLIGVISHVGALKERIATQLQVVPRTGGRSTIEGPGVLRVEQP